MATFLNIRQENSTLLHGIGDLVGRVLDGDQEMLCKARTMGLLDPYLERELESMQKTQKARRSHSTSMRVSQL